MSFTVHALNVHTNASETYGPFPGTAQLTYEHLRETERGDEIFVYVDPQDIGATATDPNPHDYDTWRDAEDCLRFDGWRRVRRIPTDDGKYSVMDYADAHFWTDLVIEPVE